MLVNTLLGTILWTTYAETSKSIETCFGQHPILCAGLAGGVAGGTQALFAAPAENFRIALEGRPGGSTWLNAWKEVFRDTRDTFRSRNGDIEDIRQLRGWLKDVGDMAGRGWTGWGWGFGKDVCGFASFFAIFEITRRTAVVARNACRQHFQSYSEQYKLSSVAHSVTLLTGGVVAGLAYEKVTLPWDVARRMVLLEKSIHPAENHPVIPALWRNFREGGLCSFFKTHGPTNANNLDHSRTISTALRALGRVGPWGVGFLVWETWGAGSTIDGKSHNV